MRMCAGMPESAEVGLEPVTLSVAQSLRVGLGILRGLLLSSKLSGV